MDVVLTARGLRLPNVKIDLELGAGEVLGLVGGDVAVANALFHVLLGLQRPEQGEVRVLGLDPVAEPRRVLQQVGYLPPRPDASGWMRAKDYFQFIAPHYSVWNEDLIDELIEPWSIPMQSKFKAIGAGHVLRVQLLALLAQEPKLLLINLVDGVSGSLLRLAAVVATLHEFLQGGGAILCAVDQDSALESLPARLAHVRDGGYSEVAP